MPSPEKKRKLARKVAQKYLSQSLRDQMQSSSSQARLRVSELDSMVERALAIIEDSDHKEHIYKEAGDMITRFQEVLEGLKDDLAEINYLISNLATEGSSKELNPSKRKELDRLLESSTDPQDLQGLPTFIQEVPDALKKDKADSESIYDVDRADDVAKRQPQREVIDYSGLSLQYTKPDVGDDYVP